MRGDEGTSREEEEIPDRGRAIFFVDQITFNPKDDFLELPRKDVSPEVFEAIHPHDPVPPPRSLTATHKTVCPLDTIMGSTLNQAAGRVRAIYLNMQPIGWVSVNPHAQDVEDIGATAFENMLSQLSHAGKLFNAHDNEVIGHTVADVSAIICGFPTNIPVIGCISGESPGDSVKLVDYISAVDDDQTFVFVVGEFANGEIADFVDHMVQACKFQATA